MAARAGGPRRAAQRRSRTTFSFRWNPQLWAAQGWVVGIVNFHGSTGFGQEFTDSITGDLGTKPMTDIMKATDWFEQQPWIDKNRIAAAGGSYGGYMMAWLNGHTDRFKAMVCHAGVYNWHSMMASDFVKGRERSLGAPPWGDLAHIDKQSAAAVRRQLQDADARPARREGFPRAGHAGAASITTRSGRRACRRGWSISPTRTTGC